MLSSGFDLIPDPRESACLFASCFTCNQLPVLSFLSPDLLLPLFPGWFLVWKLFLSRFRFVRELLFNGQMASRGSRTATRGSPRHED